jgi:hypothetical protein
MQQHVSLLCRKRKPTVKTFVHNTAKPRPQASFLALRAAGETGGVHSMQRKTSGAAVIGMNTTIKYMYGAAGIGLSTTIKYLVN